LLFSSDILLSIIFKNEQFDTAQSEHEHSTVTSHFAPLISSRGFPQQIYPNSAGHLSKFLCSPWQISHV